MAAYYINRSHDGLQSFAGRIGARLANVYAAIVDWNDARVTRKALMRLTDRELDDIGLCRADIGEFVANGRF